MEIRQGAYFVSTHLVAAYSLTWISRLLWVSRLWIIRLRVILRLGCALRRISLRCARIIVGDNRQFYPTVLGAVSFVRVRKFWRTLAHALLRQPTRIDIMTAQITGDTCRTLFRQALVIAVAAQVVGMSCYGDGRGRVLIKHVGD